MKIIINLMVEYKNIKKESTRCSDIRIDRFASSSATAVKIAGRSSQGQHLTVFMTQSMFNHMGEHQSGHLNHTYQALADPTRRAILTRLAQGEVRVTDLAEPFNMSLNAVSKHVRLLERAGLVQREVRGREHYLIVDPAPLREATDWLNTYQQFWRQRLDRLEAFLRRQKGTQRDRRAL